jgi:hypothetical protein
MSDDLDFDQDFACTSYMHVLVEWDLLPNLHVAN